MTQRTTRRLVAVLLAVTVVSGAFAGSAAAATNGTITANPSSPGATAQHLVTVTVGSATASSSWNGFTVDYSGTGADVSNVSEEDVVKIGIDRGNDNAGDRIDVNVSDDLSAVSSSNNGQTLTFTLGGSYSVSERDELVVVYDDVVNPPETGVSDIALDINPQSSGGETVAKLDIEESTEDSPGDETTTESGDETTTESGDETTTQSGEETTQTTEQTQQTTESDSGATETTSGGSPGFGLGVALVAFAGTAFLATRD